MNEFENWWGGIKYARGGPYLSNTYKLKVVGGFSTHYIPGKMIYLIIYLFFKALKHDSKTNIR